MPLPASRTTEADQVPVKSAACNASADKVSIVKTISFFISVRSAVYQNENRAPTWNDRGPPEPKMFEVLPLGCP